jgi:hypothetical protein
LQAERKKEKGKEESKKFVSPANAAPYDAGVYLKRTAVHPFTEQRVSVRSGSKAASTRVA